MGWGVVKGFRVSKCLTGLVRFLGRWSGDKSEERNQVRRYSAKPEGGGRQNEGGLGILQMIVD